MTQDRINDIKSYMKSSAANFFVLHNTSNTLARIQKIQREQQPLCAQRMKSKKDQFNYLQNSKAFKTQAIQI